MENLLENTDSLKGVLQKKVRENADQIRLSKYLATIKTDVPVDISVSSLERKPMDVDKLLEVYGELEFRTLAARLKAGARQESGRHRPAAAPAPPQPEADSSGMGIALRHAR